MRLEAVPEISLTNLPRYVPPRSQMMSPGRAGDRSDRARSRLSGRSLLPVPEENTAQGGRRTTQFSSVPRSAMLRSSCNIMLLVRAFRTRFDFNDFRREGDRRDE